MQNSRQVEVILPGSKNLPGFGFRPALSSLISIRFFARRPTTAQNRIVEGSSVQESPCLLIG